jgi:hypothetical protein
VTGKRTGMERRIGGQGWVRGDMDMDRGRGRLVERRGHLAIGQGEGLCILSEGVSSIKLWTG